MAKSTADGSIVAKYTGKGEITFPQGGRINCFFELTEYATGKRLLSCTGQFPKDSYASWARLVHQYRVDPRQLGDNVQAQSLAERFAGATADSRKVTIQQMFLIGAQSGGFAEKNLALQMQFDCQDLNLAP